MPFGVVKAGPVPGGPHRPQRGRGRRGVAQRRQRGVVLITVTVVGLILVAVLATVAAYFGQTESRAVAGSLLAVRAHWALMGHVHYARSRLRQVPSALHNGPDPDTTDPTFDQFADDPVDGLNNSRFQSPLPACISVEPTDSGVTPTQITQCVLNELRTYGEADGGGFDFADEFERCWTYREYNLAIMAVDPPAVGVLPNDSGGPARRGVRLRFELSRLATGAVGSAPPCGDDSAPPPFATGTVPARLVPALSVGIFIDNDDGGSPQQTHADISDLWRSSD